MATTGIASRIALLMIGGILLVGLLLARAWLTPNSPTTLVPTPLGTPQEAPLPAAGPAHAPVAAAVRLDAGAFGALPPLALPGELGPRPTFVYERPPDLAALPTTADVHQLIWDEHTLETVRDLARRLDLAGPVETLGPDTFQVEADSQGRLFVAHGRIVYTRPGTPAADPPSLDQAGEQARQWLAERELLPPDAGPPGARLLPGAELALVVFTPLVPHALLTAEPSVSVTIDGAGIVRALDSLWPARQQVATYPLSGPIVWAAIERGQGFVELDGDLSRLDGRPAGRIRLTGASLGYALAGDADAASAAFLEPVYVFQGIAELVGQATPVPCRVYVPALRDYPWPHG